MTNTTTSESSELLERLDTLTITAEQIKSDLNKLRAEISQVLGEVRSLPHGNEYARTA